MLLIEYCIPLPFSLEEYQVAQLYCVAKMSMDETLKLIAAGKPEGVEIIENRPFTDDAGVYNGKWTYGTKTLKYFYLFNKLNLNAILMKIVNRNKDMLTFIETAYNCFPFCHTTSRNKKFNEFECTTISMHRDFDPRDGFQKDVFSDEPKHVQVIVDIGDNFDDENPGMNPCMVDFHNKQAVPKLPGPKWWQKHAGPLICAYKLVKTKGGINYFVDSHAESFMQDLYCVANASLNETGAGDGVEVLVNEPFKDHEPLFNDNHTAGQYTKKVYHMNSKVGGFVTAIAPKGSLTFREEAWNAYPYCRTILHNDYMAENFESKFETLHVDSDFNLENAHQLSPELLAVRKVIYVDISDNSQIAHSDYKPADDPCLFKSEKGFTDPLVGPCWWENGSYKGPIMCAYKLCFTNFKWWGLQTRVEAMLQNQAKRLFTSFHRQLFCWQDSWKGMSMEQLRKYEDEVKHILDEARANSEIPTDIESRLNTAIASTPPVPPSEPVTLPPPPTPPKKLSIKEPEELSIEEPEKKPIMGQAVINETMEEVKVEVLNKEPERSQNKYSDVGVMVSAMSFEVEQQEEKLSSEPEKKHDKQVAKANLGQGEDGEHLMFYESDTEDENEFI
ncbi:hypothetical protein Ciccas_000552 [Cichlidogyrus casuarinus]|uniref:Phosphatidylinositol transfer protein N-terminal domain-containing protein n=1 Tax=Cichlidogyrus casuarinus TaxID=1844966 RepID=A0ABD2QMK9_9PLAT